MVAVHAASVDAERGRGDYDDRQIHAWAWRHTPERLAERMSRRTFVVAQAGHDLVAYGQLDVAAGVLRSLHVAPEWQRQGVGRRVANDLLAQARAAGRATVELDASLNAVGFYRSLGFDELERVAHPLADGIFLTCVRMVKRLAP
jgi:putative acetyltransferase